MEKRRIAMGLLGLLGLSVVACGQAEAEEDEPEASGAAVSGSLANAKACAIRERYVAASLPELTALDAGELPEKVAKALAARWENDPPEAVAMFNVAGVGEIYVVDQTHKTSTQQRTNLDFFDKTGKIILFGLRDPDGNTTFSGSFVSPGKDGFTSLDCTKSGS